MNGRRSRQQRASTALGSARSGGLGEAFPWWGSLHAAGLMTGVLMPFLPTAVLALPEGGTIAAGTATVTVPTANSLRIEQTTDRLVMDWTRFNIAANESVHFQQPSAASIALNRVSGQEPSAIFGSLSANGQIFLVNPSGILFGSSSRVDVGALTASTLTMTNQDFLNSQYRFTQDPSAANAAVVNQGVITAGPGGYVALLAAAAHNEGVIQAQLGSIALASGQAATLDMRGDGLIQFVITDAVSGTVNGPDGQPVASYVSNTGTLQADGGLVTLQAKAAAGLVRSVVNQEGIVRATSLVNHGGVIMLVADGDHSIVWNKGTLDVSAGETDATPGYIAISGALAGQSGTILARGAERAAGGHVDMTSTQQTELFAGSLIDVSGNGNSDGGSVRVWSDKDTAGASGAQILARGGESGGDGGFVETSGKESLAFAGSVDASAPRGKNGMWLLDPNNITIQAAGAETNVTASPTFTSTDDTAIVTTGSIQTALNAGTSVSVTTASAGANTQAGNIITVASSISKTAGGDATLTLSANNDITVNAGVAISSTTGKLHVALGADSDGSGAGAIVLTNGSSVTSLGGNITLGGGTNPGGLVNGALPATGATGHASNIAGISSGAGLDAGGGNIWLMGTGYAGAAGGDAGISLVTASNLQTSGTGTITLIGNGGGSGASGSNIGVSLSGTTVQTSGSGDISITGTGGSVGSGNNNYGVTATSSTIQTTGTGNITIWGHGGNTAGGSTNYGIFLTSTSTTRALGTGTISLSGYGGNNGVGVGINQGVEVEGLIAGGGSPILINGTGGTSYGVFNWGFRLRWYRQQYRRWRYHRGGHRRWKPRELRREQLWIWIEQGNDFGR